MLGAGVAGVEAARVAAGLGHQVEIWEKAAKPGGQMPLALAAPDKADVAGVWTYRWEQIESLGVPVRTGVNANAESIRDFRPDLVVVATGAKPRPLPFPIRTRVPLLHAWDVLLEQERVPRGARVTIIGGGMVGIETADTLIHYRGVKATVIEGLPVIAKEMARNNRYDVLDRLAKSGARVLTSAPVESIEDDRIWAMVGGVRTPVDAGDLIISAIGPVAQPRYRARSRTLGRAVRAGRRLQPDRRLHDGGARRLDARAGHRHAVAGDWQLAVGN